MLYAGGQEELFHGEELCYECIYLEVGRGRNKPVSWKWRKISCLCKVWGQLRRQRCDSTLCLKKTHSKWQKHPKKPTTSPKPLSPVLEERKTQLSLNTDESMWIKRPSYIINYYFEKKTGSFSFNSNIQIFPLAEQKRGERLQADHCTLGFCYHYLLIYPLLTT